MKKTYRWPVGAGALFLVAALIWWLVAVPLLVRYPDDLDTTLHYRGTVTFNVDPETGAPLADPIDVPLTIDRRIAVVDSTLAEAVVAETITTTFGATEQVDRHSYVLDRRSMRFESGARSYAYGADNVVDRSGMYRVNLPMEVDIGDRYRIWNNETGAFYRLESAGGEATVAGEKVLRFKGSLPNQPVAPYYAEVLEERGLPSEATLAQLAPQLKAAGIDVAKVVPALATVLKPADLAAVNQVLAKPIPLRYTFSFRGEIGVEPETGAIVQLRGVDETIAVQPDLSAVLGLVPILTPYAANPVIQQVGAGVSALAQRPPSPVYRVRYSQTPASVRATMAEAQDQLDKIVLAERYVPWTLAALGVVLLAAGALVWRRSRPTPVPVPVPTRPEREVERRPVGVR